MTKHRILWRATYRGRFVSTNCVPEVEIVRLYSCPVTWRARWGVYTRAESSLAKCKAYVTQTANGETPIPAHSLCVSLRKIPVAKATVEA